MSSSENIAFILTRLAVLSVGTAILSDLHERNLRSLLNQEKDEMSDQSEASEPPGDLNVINDKESNEIRETSEEIINAAKKNVPTCSPDSTIKVYDLKKSEENTTQATSNKRFEIKGEEMKSPESSKLEKYSDEFIKRGKEVFKEDKPTDFSQNPHIVSEKELKQNETLDSSESCDLTLLPDQADDKNITKHNPVTIISRDHTNEKISDPVLLAENAMQGSGGSVLMKKENSKNLGNTDVEAGKVASNLNEQESDKTMLLDRKIVEDATKLDNDLVMSEKIEKNGEIPQGKIPAEAGEDLAWTSDDKSDSSSFTSVTTSYCSSCSICQEKADEIGSDYSSYDNDVIDRGFTKYPIKTREEDLDGNVTINTPKSPVVFFLVADTAKSAKNALPQSPWPGKKSRSGSTASDNYDETNTQKTHNTLRNDSYEADTASHSNIETKKTFSADDSGQMASPQRYVVTYTSASASSKTPTKSLLTLRMQYDSNDPQASLHSNAIGNLSFFIEGCGGLHEATKAKTSLIVKINILTSSYKKTRYRIKTGVGNITDRTVDWEKEYVIRNIPSSTLREAILKVDVMQKETFSDRSVAYIEVKFDKQERFGSDDNDVSSTAERLVVKKKPVNAKLNLI